METGALTISKRFQFSASHRLTVPEWSREQNLLHFGAHNQGEWGYGRNYTAYFIFSGPVDKNTGMLINVTEIKREVNKVLSARFDHKYFNKDTPPFNTGQNPTVENVAAQLLSDVQPLFKGYSSQPCGCHVTESPVSEATAYSDGRVERHLHIDFSAARRTYSPLLSESENNELFGIAASRSGHGHHYGLRVTLGGEIHRPLGMIFPDHVSLPFLETLRERFDHKNLNTDIPELGDMPITTEKLAQFFEAETAKELPVVRVRLRENDYFAVESGRDRDSGAYLGMAVSTSFHAAHRLHSPYLTDEENLEVYSICNNPNGHGHHYRVEALFCGELDERSGTVYDLGKALNALDEAIAPWKYKHLDRDTGDFRDKPSTAENIVKILGSRLKPKVDIRVSRLRLWETDNNRFTLR